MRIKYSWISSDTSQQDTFPSDLKEVSGGVWSFRLFINHKLYCFYLNINIGNFMHANGISEIRHTLLNSVCNRFRLAHL